MDCRGEYPPDHRYAAGNPGGRSSHACTVTENKLLDYPVISRAFGNLNRDDGSSAHDAVGHLSAAAFDAVVSYHGMPERNVIVFLRHLGQPGDTPPFITSPEGLRRGRRAAIISR